MRLIIFVSAKTKQQPFLTLPEMIEEVYAHHERRIKSSVFEQRHYGRDCCQPDANAGKRQASADLLRDAGVAMAPHLTFIVVRRN